MNRRTVTNELTVIYWRDIPAQVTARSGREKATIELPRRFQAAIDRAAKVAGKEKYDDYIGEWRRETTACTEDLQASVNAEAARLSDLFPRDQLVELVDNGGINPAKESS